MTLQNPTSTILFYIKFIDCLGFFILQYMLYSLFTLLFTFSLKNITKL